VTDAQLIEGGLVLVENARWEAVSLLVEEGRIAALLPPGEAAGHARRVDASARLVLPGLVNGHTHSHGALGRGGVPDDMVLETFLSGCGWLSAARDADDLALSAQLSAVELIRRGCTACYDLCIELPGPTAEGIHAVAGAYEAAGLRAVVAPMIADRTIYEALPGLLDAFEPPLREAVAALSLPPWPELVATCAEAVRRWPTGSGRVRPGIGPAIPLHCSDDLLRAAAELSREGDLPVQTHLAETRLQQILAQERYGSTLTAHLDALGVLSPRFSGAHGVWLSEAEADLLAAHGAGISHNPMSNLRLGSGIAPARRLADAGVTLGIGTDASNTSDGQNMFEATRLAATLSRARGEDTAAWLRAPEALRMATEGSARLMGLDRVGRIAPGWAADLIFLDRDAPGYVPLRRPTDQVVLSESGAGLREVMVAGRTVFAEGRVLTVDEAALNARAHAAAERLAHASEDARLLNQAAAEVVRGFCSARCAAHPT
jgi:guanine deaminase